MTSDLGALPAAIGRAETERDIVTERLATALRAVLGQNLAPVEAGDLPLAGHWCLAPTILAADELGPDHSTANRAFPAPPGLPRRMWAGGAIEFLQPIRIGEPVSRRCEIVDVALKRGRSGELCFLTERHDYTTSRGLAIRETRDVLYRPAESVVVRPAPTPAPRSVPALSWRIEATPALLFRYSALTFNAHRIHYDYPYATEVEGYPDLVVHGPLQATLALNLAATVGGRPPRCFRYRGTAPLFAGGAFDVHAADIEDHTLTAWVTDRRGGMTMEATATW